MLNDIVRKKRVPLRDETNVISMLTSRNKKTGNANRVKTVEKRYFGIQNSSAENLKAVPSINLTTTKKHNGITEVVKSDTENVINKEQPELISTLRKSSRVKKPSFKIQYNKSFESKSKLKSSKCNRVLNSKESIDKNSVLIKDCVVIIDKQNLEPQNGVPKTSKYESQTKQLMVLIDNNECKSKSNSKETPLNSREKSEKELRVVLFKECFQYPDRIFKLDNSTNAQLTLSKGKEKVVNKEDNENTQQIKTQVAVSKNLISTRRKRVVEKPVDNMQTKKVDIDYSEIIKKAQGDEILEIPNDKRMLRVKEPRKYDEESIHENSFSDAKSSKPHKVPVYRTLIPDETKSIKPVADLYEFNDFSPKRKINKIQRDRKSSILFDKETYALMKKIEAKETKLKRKVVRRDRKPVKTYDKIVNGIVKNVLEKIQKKTSECVMENCKTVVHINNFSEEINVIIHRPPEARNDNLTIQKEMNVPPHNTLENAWKAPYNEIFACDEENNDYLDVPDRIEGETDTDENEFESCFGFEDASPQSDKINIISDILIKDTSTPDSYQKLVGRRPNANSTMFSPWRVNWITTRPHFVSVKSNALPRLDQEMVLDHKLVDELEESLSKAPAVPNKTPTKKVSIQQSILDFVESNVEKDKQTDRSLFDYEEFNSPIKKKPLERDNSSAVRRVLDAGKLISSTPTQRRVLQDISNSSNSDENTYFGFDSTNDGSRTKSPRKNKENKENSFSSKPIRYDTNTLKMYASKTRKNNVKPAKTASIEAPPCEVEANKSVSIIEDSREATDGGEFKLFDDPEDILDNMSPVIVAEKKRRRRRLDSTSSDASDCKAKRHKKTKLEIEQENWIEQFTRECESVEVHELDVE